MCGHTYFCSTLEMSKECPDCGSSSIEKIKSSGVCADGIIPFEISKEQAAERFEIIKETYDKALARGEKVHLIDGRHFYDKYGYSNCVQDNSHPNTLGHYAMYEAVLPVLKNCLG